MESLRQPPAISGGPRKAGLSLLQGLLSTSTTRAVRAEAVGLARRISPQCDGVQGIRRHLQPSPETEDWLEPPRVGIAGFLRRRTAVESPPS